jgi:two-component system, cell cycle response regulator
MSNPRLLLATEDTALARTLSWVLKENGYDVVTALGGPQLLERLDQEVYDLLVIDLANSGAGAMDRLSRVREDTRHRDVPIFCVTESDFDLALLEPFGLSGSDAIQRPYQVRELLARIKAHLRVGRELNKARAEARSRNELVAILKEITASADSAEIYQILVRRVARCSVVIATPGESEGTVVAAYENPNLRDLRVDLNKYPEIKRALETGETVMVSDIDADPLYQDVLITWGSQQTGGRRTKSVIALPFTLAGRRTGVFFLRTTADDPPLNRLDLGFAEQVIEAAVTALEKAYDLEHGSGNGQLRELADTDPLTGCANRRVLDARLREELDRARRYDQVVTVVLLDVDDFKRINDTFGHQVGDRVLKQLAFLLRRELRTMDFLARYGGEEFVVVLPETGGTGARLFTDRILRRVQQHNFGDAAVPVNATVSAGLATFPDDRAADDDALMRLADENLYKAKRAGRNRYRD